MVSIFLMEQKKIEHITLHLIVFETIVIIGVLARQTALHYGWDEFSSYLIFVVCSIVWEQSISICKCYSDNFFHLQ